VPKPAETPAQPLSGEAEVSAPEPAPANSAELAVVDSGVAEASIVEVPAEPEKPHSEAGNHEHPPASAGEVPAENVVDPVASPS